MHPDLYREPGHPIVSDMFIVRRMVDDVLKLMIMKLSVAHERTHGARTVLFMWTCRITHKHIYIYSNTYATKGFVFMHNLNFPPVP